MALKEVKISKTLKRTILLNPGPSTTTEGVKLSVLQDDICHREEEFAAMTREVMAGLTKVVTKNTADYETVLFAGSGTIIIDVATSSLVPDGKKILVINNGAYSQRAIDAATMARVPVVEVKFGLLESFDLAKIEEALKANPDVHMVYTTHQETATGIFNPVKEVGALAKKYGKIFTVDTISTLGVLPFDMEEENMDFVMASSQKGLNAYTGISWITGRRAEIEKTKDYKPRSYYTNLWRQYDFFKKNNQMHFTPPVQIMYSLRQAIKEHFEEGPQKKYERFLAGWKAVKEEMEKLGFRSIVPWEKQAGFITSLQSPDDPNFNFDKIHDYLYERGITIYPGKLAGLENFRICNLGSLNADDIRYAFKVLVDAMKEFKVAIPVKYNS